MGFVVTAGESKAIKSFCKAQKIGHEKTIQLAPHFDLKASGQMYHGDDYITLDGTLAEAVYVARRISEETGCPVVEFAWPEGAGVVLGKKTLITSIPSDGYYEMSKVDARDEYVAEGHTLEEAEALLEENGNAYDNVVDFRDWLQQSWQAQAARANDYPDKATLGKTEPFSKLFELGYDLKYFSAKAIAAIDKDIAGMVGKGPSYTDLEKAKAYLMPMPDDDNQGERIRNFFDSAPKSFLDKVGNFEALIPVAGGWIIEYGSRRVRSSVKLGRIAARSINGWGSGFEYLEEPARSDRQVMCTALAGNPRLRQYVPKDVQKDLDIFVPLLRLDAPLSDPGQLNERAAPKALAIKHLDEAIALSVGYLNDGGLEPTELVALYRLVQAAGAKRLDE